MQKSGHYLEVTNALKVDSALLQDNFSDVRIEVQNSRFTKSSYEIELRQNNLTRRVTNLKILLKFFLRVTNLTSENIKFHFELLTRKLNFYFSTFKVLTRS